MVAFQRTSTNDTSYSCITVALCSKLNCCLCAYLSSCLSWALLGPRTVPVPPDPRRTPFVDLPPEAPSLDVTVTMQYVQVTSVHLCDTAPVPMLPLPAAHRQQAIEALP